MAFRRVLPCPISLEQSSFVSTPVLIRHHYSYIHTKMVVGGGVGGRIQTGVESRLVCSKLKINDERLCFRDSPYNIFKYITYLCNKVNQAKNKCKINHPNELYTHTALTWPAVDSCCACTGREPVWGRRTRSGVSRPSRPRTRPRPCPAPGPTRSPSRCPCPRGSEGEGETLRSAYVNTSRMNSDINFRL
jgi:hypothetical protein